ncbi:response regulator [Adhaeribacter swui]|uniref:Response regulator n=1 Tax=Adhaeribacter swui TaxID=2086471 RepID=A0A7G7G5A8_9BACT|nr:response regulator [Adhaeribacter swui]QNF32342.1 response regulator [Adhaeribacter swui]
MEFIRQLVDVSPNPIYVRDELGKLALVNEAFAQLHQQSAATILQKGFLNSDYAYNKDLEILKLNKQVTLEEVFEQENGQKIWFTVTKKPFKSPDGARFLLSTFNDVTPFKNAFQEKKESTQVKQLFLTHLKEEFKADINTISSLTRLLKKGLINKEQESYLHLIQSVADNLLDAPDQILEFSKLQTGITAFKTTPFDIASILQYTISAFISEAEDQQLELQLGEVPPSLPLVQGDPHRLNQILTNLISYSVKHTSQGQLSVSARIQARLEKVVHIAFSVRTSNWQSKPDKLERFFASSSNGNHEALDTYNNLDVKLRICKKIVELQGGRIWLELLPNQEIQFSFIIPYPVSAETNQTETPELSEDLNKLKGLRILLAEDNPANQLLVVSQLKYWEAHVDVAQDGIEACEKAHESPYDLVLMDIDMPRMNGIEATATIRQEPNPNQNTPIVAFTANAYKIDINRYKESGFSDYLFKPYTETNLYLTIARNITDKQTAKNEEDTVEVENHLTATDLNNLQPLSAATIPTEPEPLTPSEPEPALYDFSGLGNLAEDANFVKKMQRLFIDLVPSQLENLTASITQQDWNSVAQIAHSLKSTYGNIGIKTAAQAATKIEEIGSKKINFSDLTNLMQIIDITTKKVITAFQEQLHSEIES